VQPFRLRKITIKTIARGLVTITVFIVLWELIIWGTSIPHYLLPGPMEVLRAWGKWSEVILQHASVTLLEIVLGLIIGTMVGIVSATIIAQVRAARRWLLPVLVVSQAIPVFAIAPLLVMWLGYGIASKIAMAALIIYFPVTASFLDGLRRTDPGWLDLVQIMTSKTSGNSWAALRLVRVPAAMPSLASGIRVAAAVAPIGAVVGEWVGSGAGLGYLMLHSNARTQIDVMFAALVTLAVIAVALYFTVDWLMRHLVAWQSDTFS